MAIKIKKTDGKTTSSGFTLLEVIFATLITAVGLLTLLAVFSQAVATAQLAQEESIARAEAQRMIESIYSARNTAQVAFIRFQNVSQDATNGMFLDGLQSMNDYGPDGLPNTSDDLSSIEIGPNGQPLSNFQRSIAFAPVYLSDGVTVDGNVRAVTVTIQYQTGNRTRTYSQQSYISTYR
ncbi:MAG TPA: hypothetical protein VEG30_01755 [Terriglobales bacterium]|nr:hypothetical protein [Terriglobales bacterium]